MPEPDPPDRPLLTPNPDPSASSSPGPLAAGGAPHLTRGFLFADLRDYTSYVDAHGDHAGAELLARYRALVRGAVAAAQGAEIKTEGDSFYVVFDSASAAVRCGQEIIAAADAAPGEPIRVGVGVHAGETVETSEGFVGSAVNIAARLCGQAKAGELVVSDTVRALTRTYLDVDFEPLGSRRLKGVNEQIALYRVVPHGTAPVRARRAPRGGPGLARWIAGAAGVVALLVVVGTGAALLQGSTAAPTAAPGGGATPEPSAPPSGPPASAAPGGLTAAEQALLARVPRDFQPYCRRSSLPDGALGGTANLRCDLPVDSPGYGADAVWYDAFAERGPMSIAVNGVVERQRLPVGDCGPDTTGVVGRWELGITFTGQLACYVKDDGAWVLWTYEGDQIAARAVRRDGDAESLYGWWKDLASGFLR